MKTTTRNLISTVTELAISDYHNHVPVHHRTNSGTALSKRIVEYGIRIRFNGDFRYLRAVYSAAYWWESMQLRRDELNCTG